MKFEKKDLTKNLKNGSSEVLVAVVSIVAGVYTLKTLPSKFAPYVVTIAGVLGRVLSDNRHMVAASNVIAALGGVQALKSLLTNPDGSARIAALAPIASNLPNLAGASTGLLLGMGETDFSDIDTFELEEGPEFDDDDMEAGDLLGTGNVMEFEGDEEVGNLL